MSIFYEIEFAKLIIRHQTTNAPTSAIVKIFANFFITLFSFSLHTMNKTDMEKGAYAKAYAPSHIHYILYVLL